MKELPENQTLSRQINETLRGRIITGVFNATKPHKFAFFLGDPLTYERLLKDRRIEAAESFGIFVDLILDADTRISGGDGINWRYGNASDRMPDNYQLLLTLDDDAYLAFTVSMYGSIAPYQGRYENVYYQKSRERISPLSDDFDEAYFESLFAGLKPGLAVKMLLATEQRIPGLGNGVLQDILFHARIHPRRPIQSLRDAEKSALFRSVKQTLRNMTEQGGRDTESDLFGIPGGYRTILSKKTLATPCPCCGETIVKETFGGGTVYYCPGCQQR